MATLKFHADLNWEGDADQAPNWVKRRIAPWYRRMLVYPLTIYLTIATGIGIIGATNDILVAMLGWPSLALLLVIIFEADRKWWRDRYDEADLEGRIRNAGKVLEDVK